ncbi:MAG: folate family ECF transporter S component [Firmicutes bacterium]|nr:folate family ECF transporter S component [Bacillota bacterium]
MKRKEQSNTYKVVLISLMIALTLILNRVIPSTPVYHLTVDFVPVFIVAVLFGPLWAAATYAIADTIGSIILPMGPFNPGITLTLLLIGAVFGIVYYNRECTGKWIWIRAFICASATLVIKLFGTTYFLYLMYGGPNGIGYWAYVITRIPNCVIFAVLVFILLPIVQKVIIDRIKYVR